MSVIGDKDNRRLPPPYPQSFTADPNLPRWVCLNCRHSLHVVGVDSSRYGMQASAQGSVMGSSCMDHSFVVLSKQKASGHGIPPGPRNGPPLSEGSQSSKTMEESFVVLPHAAASMYRSDSASEIGGNQSLASGGSQNSNLHSNTAGFNSSIAVLQRAFDIATSQTQVEQPLCLECMQVLSDKLDKEVEDVNRDIKAYETCLQLSELESYNVLSEADFLQEKIKIEEEERKLQAAIEEAERQCSEVKAEMQELGSRSKIFKELEEKYWHEFNDFQFQLTSHQEERDAILAKIEVSRAQLELLKRTNVLDNAFTIGSEGEFGTINNFRLGRLQNIPVEWDEINAAWGQACLLLHTMAQYFRLQFPYRIKILPMGSYPRIMDINNNTYELFGPVNLFWSTRYDKAMTLFLACLKDFADFAIRRDQENNVPPESSFRLAYKIENDKVGNYTITQSFNKQENWTKALRYMLCNLRWVLSWFIGNTSFKPLSPEAFRRAEVPVVEKSS